MRVLHDCHLNIAGFVNENRTFGALEKFIPESLPFRAFAGRARPIAGKLDRVVADFIPRNRHGADDSKRT
jgi:hypothetical protein